VIYLDNGKAMQLLDLHIKRQNLKKHIFAVAAIMKSLGKCLGKNETDFYLAGLLHDLDFEETEGNPKEHGLKAAEMLRGKISEEIEYAIKAHNSENTEFEPKSEMDFALIASDAVSGLIISCALVQPTKKLADVTVESVSKKIKQKDFARNCSRERILFYEKLGLKQEEFFDISLNALKGISNDLGL